MKVSKFDDPISDMGDCMLIDADINLIVKEIEKGKVVAIPTETVYGLAVKYDDINAINRMTERKRRQGKIYTMMISNIDDMKNYVVISDYAKKIIEKYMPGKITIILPKNKDFKNVYFDSYDYIGVRIPDHKLMIEILKKSGPLLVSSANISSEQSCIDSNQVLEKVLADVIVKGISDNNLPSTVIKVTDKITILRQGDIVIDI